MHQPDITKRLLIDSMYSRAIHVLNRRNRDLWQSDVTSLRTDIDHLIDSEHSMAIENFSHEFAERLIQEGGWELQHFPEYMRDDDGVWSFDADDARAILENWPDPTRLPDGYPDQKFSDLEALEEVIFQRRKIQDKNYPTEAQSYALIAVEGVFRIESLLAQSGNSNQPSVESLMQASSIAIEAMEFVCTAERKLAQEQLPPETAEQVRKLEAEVQGRTKREMAKSGATNRWAQDPKTAAKEQVKECWIMWQAVPGRYRSKSEFARDMLEKYEELKNPETIQRWCRDWQTDAASSITTVPAESE